MKPQALRSQQRVTDSRSPNVVKFPTNFGTAGATIYGRNSTRLSWSSFVCPSDPTFRLFDNNEGAQPALL